MLNNLFSEGVYSTTRIFLSPSPQFRIIARDDFSFQNIEEEKYIYEEDPQEENLDVFTSYPYNKEKDSLVTYDEARTLEP